MTTAGTDNGTLSPTLDCLPWSATDTQETRATPQANWPPLPGYEILDELGRGGMGIVYKARQLGLNRIVAIKMVLGGPFAEPQFQARFRAEAEAVARLQHPNIVQIFAIGTQPSALGDAFSCPFFSQEYVDGGSLSERLAGKPQAPREAARFTETLARAVHYAHECGIIHRDLKPANILMQWKGSSGRGRLPDDAVPEGNALTTFEPKISDFGLAKQFEATGASPPTVSGLVCGTPEYMAPEQAVGDRSVGPAADVYALGVILYELLTGRKPLEGATPLDTLHLLREQEPVPPGRLQPKVHRDLETICLTCLRKEPARRYATAQALADDLRRFLAGEPVRARRARMPERAWRWAKRRPAVALLSAAVVFAALSGVTGITAAWLHALAGWHEADNLRNEAVAGRVAVEEQRTRAERGEALADRRRDEAEASLYFSRIAQAGLERRLCNLASAGRLLDLCTPADGAADDRRGWEWHYLRGLLHADLLTLPAAHLDFVYAVSFSPDGRCLATGGGSPFRPHPPDRVRIWDVWGETAGRCLREFPHPRMVRSVAYTGDGRRVAWAGADGTVQTADVETGVAAPARRLPEGFDAATLSPDGRRYASFDRSGRVCVWDVTGGQEVISAAGAGEAPHSLGFSPDGNRLAACYPGVVLVWDLAALDGPRSLPNADRGWCRPAFSPDGRLLAIGTSTGLVRVWDVAGGRLTQGLAGHTGRVLAVAFRPDGRCLATAGADRTVRLWETATGAELLQLRGHDGRVGNLSFHPSGRYLASGGEQPGDVKVWDLTRHQEYVRGDTVPGASRIVVALDFAQGSETLQLARAGGQLQVCEAATGTSRAVTPVDLTGQWLVPAVTAAFGANGRRLASVSAADLRVVSVADLPGGAVRHRLEHAYDVLHVAFSQDGTRLATSALARKAGGRREIRVWDADTGQPLSVLACDPFSPGRLYGAVALSADGRLLAHDAHGARSGQTEKAGSVHQIQIRDAATGHLLQSLDGLPGLTDKLVFSPDGLLLAAAGEGYGVLVFVRGEQGWRRGPPLVGCEAESVWDLAFSPDSRRLAGVSREQTFVWETTGGQMVFALRGAPHRPGDNGFNPRVAWSPDGKRLAASNWNATVSVWDAAPRHTPAAKQALHRAAEGREP